VTGLWVPDCRPDGSYESVQCHALSGYCWCVDRSGHELFGTRVRGKRTCDKIKAGLTMCQKERQIAIGWTGVAAPGSFVPKCKSSGDYDTVQCHGSTGFCWCVDDDGNEIPATRVRGRPMCGLLAGLSQCQQERQRHMGVLGIAPPGRFVPACTSTGQYERVQCHSSTGYCWCVDKFGRELPNTRAKGRVTC
ncbi:predicted protein, partial [Nematostella vectensis]